MWNERRGCGGFRRPTQRLPALTSQVGQGIANVGVNHGRSSAGLCICHLLSRNTHSAGTTGFLRRAAGPRASPDGCIAKQGQLQRPPGSGRRMRDAGESMSTTRARAFMLTGGNWPAAIVASGTGGAGQSPSAARETRLRVDGPVELVQRPATAVAGNVRIDTLNRKGGNPSRCRRI